MTSQPSVSPPLWRWAVEDDEPKTGTEDELIRQLASGRLPPYTLVWRDGWGEWLPAMQVEELSDAFPEAKVLGTRTARPSSVPGIPPVPVSEYPRLRHLARGAPLGWPDGFEGPEQEVITSEVPAAVLAEAARVMTQPSPPRDLGLQRAIARESRNPEPVVLAAFDDERTPPPSRPALPLVAEFGLQGLIEESALARDGSSWLRAYGIWVALAAIALGLGVTFALRHWAVPRAMPSVSSSVGPAAGAPPGGPVLSAPTADGVASRVVPAAALEPAPAREHACHLRQPPVSIDDWAVADVRPLIGAPQGMRGAVIVGYAQSHKSATGVTLNVESLEISRRFWQQDERQIYSVTPLSGGAKSVYHVERMGSTLASGRALDTTPALRLGMSEDALVLMRLEQRLQKLWPLPPGGRISVPEVVTHELGFTLAVREGRSAGHVRVGLLDAGGAALSALVELGSPQWDFGRPALASGPQQTALAVTRRASAGLPDAILLARAKNGQLPTELEPFEVPSGGDPELLAPVLAPLPDGGFALMWSQGVGARRVVRLQPLGASFEPRGPALELTQPDPMLGGAMSAALHWAEDRLLAFYFLRRDDGHSLWVGSVSCGN
jgi:hypothetical protein